VKASLYAVDNRLRPFGSQGELAQPVEGAVSYMKTTAGVWEMQSFLKARCVAGDVARGDEVTAHIEREIMERASREDVARAVLEMRSRLLAQSEMEGGRRIDIKKGEGGLVAVQFVIQALQLRHGIPSPPLKRTTRLLATLRSAGVLDAATYRVLFTGFRFLRRLEHHLRLVHGRALSALPENDDALDEIAAAMGYERIEEIVPRDRLRSDVSRTRRRIESAFRRLIDEPPRTEPAAIP
jgi:glutamate-ammonia-ligase adenylyltransferase